MNENSFLETQPGLSGIILLFCCLVVYYLSTFETKTYIGERANYTAKVLIVALAFIAINLLFKFFKEL
jgi:hypothetical protein